MVTSYLTKEGKKITDIQVEKCKVTKGNIAGVKKKRQTLLQKAISLQNDAPADHEIKHAGEVMQKHTEQIITGRGSVGGKRHKN